MSSHPAERVATLLHSELADFGVRLPALRAEIRPGEPPLLIVGAIPLGAGFGLLRILGDYRRLLDYEATVRA